MVFISVSKRLEKLVMDHGILGLSLYKNRYYKQSREQSYTLFIIDPLYM